MCHPLKLYAFLLMLLSPVLAQPQQNPQTGPAETSPVQNSPIHFTDITASASAAGYSADGYGHGISFADINADGKLDLLVANAIRYQILPDLLFINTGSNVFSQQAESRGVSDPGLTHSIVAADFDNDADLDLFFSNMSVYEDKHLGYGRNALYQNNGSGYFTNITQAAGIDDELNDSRGAIALDINADGWLDVFAVNWGSQNETYLNDGNGHMIRSFLGADGEVGDTSEKQGVTAADFDNDGDVDIYVCRRESPNLLYVNENGFFTERAHQLGVDVGGRSYGATFVDMDNDADLDLFVVNYTLSGTSVLPPLYVFENAGGSFIDQTTDFGFYISGYSVSFGDIDNDADLDMLLLFNQEKQPDAKPHLYLNDGTGHFTMVENSGIEVPALDSRSAAFGDIDADGDLDLYFTQKNGANHLFRNDLNNSNHYIDVICIGPRGDYGGFGSKVTVYEPGHVGEQNYILEYQESVSNYAYLCQNQTALHFGLGERTRCDLRIVQSDGHVYDYVDVIADQTVTLPIESHGTIGDVNEDLLANSTDALIVLSCDVGLDVSGFCPMDCADVNDDGVINSTDALIILSYDVGILTPFSVGQTGCHEAAPCSGCSP